MKIKNKPKCFNCDMCVNCDGLHKLQANLTYNHFRKGGRVEVITQMLLQDKQKGKIPRSGILISYNKAGWLWVNFGGVSWLTSPCNLKVEEANNAQLVFE